MLGSKTRKISRFARLLFAALLLSSCHNIFSPSPKETVSPYSLEEIDYDTGSVSNRALANNAVNGNKIDPTTTLTCASATVNGLLAATGASNLGGTLTVTGTSTLNSSLTVNGAATLSSTLAVTGTSAFTGASTFTGAANLNGGANVALTSTATAAGNVMGVNDTLTANPGGASAASFYGGYHAVSYTSTSNNTAQVTGGMGYVNNNSTATLGVSYGQIGRSFNNAGGTLTNSYGVYGDTYNNAAGTVTLGNGVYGAIVNNGAGTITTGYALHGSLTNAGGTVTTYHGLQLDDPGTGYAAGKYNIYSAGGVYNYIGGRLGIGVAAPTTALQVNGEIAPAADNATTLGDAALRFSVVWAGNGAIQTSDAREKKDIRETDLGLDFVNRLHPISYHWNNGLDGDLHYGFIAQETEKLIREIRGREESTIVLHDQKTDRYGLKYTELFAPVVKAIQELFEKLSALEGRFSSSDREIQALLKENALLKARLDRIEQAVGASPHSAKKAN
jgi:trimeric autotransporter adhesin